MRFVAQDMSLHERKHRLLSEGATICDLSMINPDILPPRFLLDKLLEASFKPANHRYAVARGIRRAREAFAHKYSTRFGVNLNPGDEVCVTLGTKDAMQHLMRVFKARGIVRIISTSPSYAPIGYAAAYSGLEVEFVELSNNCSDLGVCHLIDALDRALASKSAPAAVVLNFPNNPTGLCLDAEGVEKIVGVCQQHRTLLINDFAYGESGFGDFCPPSFLSSSYGSSGVVETFTMSKAYSVPGWRVAALVGAAEIVGAVARLKSQVDYGLFLPFQLASAAALTASEDLTFAIRSEYQRRARCLREILISLGWVVNEPQGGASLWARLPSPVLERGQTARGVAEELLIRGIAVSPEDAFLGGQRVPGEELSSEAKGSLARQISQNQGEHIRFALVAPELSLRRLADRLDVS